MKIKRCFRARERERERERERDARENSFDSSGCYQEEPADTNNMKKKREENGMVVYEDCQ